MPAGTPPPIASILASRTGEEMALNDRYLNPQMGRILRTLGFYRTWTGGEGAHLIDSEGERYLDLFGGYGVFAIGRNHPEAVAAVRETMEARTGNMPQLGVTLLNGVLAEQLVERAGLAGCRSIAAMVPANSGTEAVEAAIKIARAATGRRRILYAEHAFHGLTLGSLSINGNAEFRDGFGPLLEDCVAVPFGDTEALRAELERGDVAALVLEPVQGKGVNLPPAGYLEGAQELCRRYGTLFCVDEVQTGFARTGKLFALEHWGLEPDLVTMAKSLSGGYVPVGACAMSRSVFERVNDSLEHAVRHGSTFAPNELGMVAGLATLAEIDRAGLVERTARLGRLLLDLTGPLRQRHDVVKDVRGLGLIWAIEFGEPKGGSRTWQALERRQAGIFSQFVVGPLFHRHRILSQVAGHHLNVIKALPPLTIEEADLERFAGALDEAIDDATPLTWAAIRFATGAGLRSIA